MSSRKSKHVALPGKLSPPRLGRVFDRERLFTLLDGWADSPALWIAAPPGAGKSTLVATWLEHHQQPTLWLQVDAGDADPATFVQSLDTLLGQDTDAPIELPAFQADDLADLAGWLRRRLRLVLAQLPPTWSLVFDNHQELPPDSPLHAALAQALGELPRGAQWIFISREQPPSAYTRALAQQQLAVLDADSLQFDEHETLALTRLHGRPEAMAAALASAQGWAGGMTLMLLGSPRQASVAGLDARQRLFDYFAGEVLAGMPAADQDALCAIAFLPSATADMAAEISACAAAPALLERLAALSLFTDRREGPPTAYVFHALFSEFLRKRYERMHSAPALQTLQQRAAQMLEAAGQVDAALQRLVDAQSWADAQALLLRSSAQFVANGRTQTLLQHIDRLPPALQDGLAYWRGFCRLDTDPAGALADLSRAQAVGAAAGDVDGQLATAAAAATALITIGRLSELDPWIELLTRHAAHAAEVQPEDVEMRWVPGLLAAVIYRAPWHPLADALAERAERLLHRDAAPGQRLLLGSLAFHLLWRGHLDRLERIVLRIDALCAQPSAAPATLMRWWGVGILVKTLLGYYDAARHDAARALALVAAEPSVATQRTYVELLHMIIALADGDAASSRRHMHRAAQALHPDNAVDRSVYEHQRGMLALLEDDSATALRLMRASVASARLGGFPMREHVALIANALAAARSGEHDEAARLVDAVFAHPFHTICRWHHWVGGVVATYAALRRGDEPEALRLWRAALAVARDCGYRHGPMLYCCGGMMSELSALALAHGIEPDVVRDLVLRNDLAAPPQADASWPWAVRIRALGVLQIERADGPLPASRKESRRLLELLRLLVAQGDTAAPLDALADALWPDADGDAARNALDNALHRLRKLLGGDDRIVLRQGTLQLNAQRCWTDVRGLEFALDQLDGCAAKDKTARAAAVRQLYRAPLLADDTLPAVVQRRKTLHQRVVRALQAAGIALAADETGQSLPDL